MILRTASPTDVEAILALWKRAGVAGSLPDTADALRIRMQRDPDLFVIAEDEGDAIGSLIGGWDGWRANMYRLAVDPDYRRRGIARALVREVEARLVTKGARRVTALVLREEEAATEFWSAVGYEADPAISRHVRNL